MAKSSTKKEDVTEGSDRKADVYERIRPQEIDSHQIDGQRILFHAENGIELRLTVHTTDIIQLRYLHEWDNPSEFSYAIDPDFNSKAPEYEVVEQEVHFELSTSSLLCRIYKKDMTVDFYDRDENLLCSDQKPYVRKQSLMKGTTDVRIAKKAPKGETYYGLGDKITEKGLRGEKFENWNTDSFAYDLDKAGEPLYRSIPFYSALNEGRAYGIFMDNTYRSHFDFDSKGKGQTTFSAAGGNMNYYFIHGPELTTVTERYTKLTGTPELPPLWALGYHQCKWSYYPESQVRKIAHAFREKKIPCDSIYLDIDYMDGYRCFTWNKERFPDPKKMIADLKEDGFETIVMIDPGIKVDKDYFVFKEGWDNDYFLKRPDGELMVGPVWPPKVAYPDYTNPEVRDWWAKLYQGLMAETGVSGVWNDMNEPAMFEVKKKTIPEDVRHHYEGEKSSHKKAHNIYGMQMARASLKGIKKYNHGKRPFLLTRANFSGGQRFAALWTGDNIASWRHLKLANQQCQRLSISGYSFVGTDIGGFVKNPTAELFTRWLQLSVFHPLFRNHSMGYNVDGASAVKDDAVELKKKNTKAEQEPWTFGKKYTDINRSVIELRYRLLHYLYTAYHQYVENGTPILRPLAYYNQQDKKAVRNRDEFLFGNHILVSPVLKKKKKTVNTYFPKGRWYDYRTNEVFEGEKSYSIDAPIEEIPFFVKAGSVLPLREVMQYTKQHTPKLLELNVYYGGSETVSHLYEDAEDGYDYKKGDFQHTTFTQHIDNDQLTLTADRKGKFEPSYKNVQLNVIGLPFTPAKVKVDERDVSETSISGNSVLEITVEPDFEKIEIS